MSDTATMTPPPAAETPELDSLNRPFDAAKFKREKDSVGRWKNLHAGRRKASTAPAAGASSPASEPAAANFDDINRAAGAGAADVKEAGAVVMDDNATADSVIGIIQTALVLIGDEEGVLSDTEKTLLRRPLVRILEKYNVGKDVLPVEVDLALAFAGIVITRLQKPKTATFYAKAKAWFVNVWFRGKGHLLAREVREAVRPAAPAAS